MIVVDTSAFFAVVDASDRWHRVAVDRLTRIVRDGAEIATTNYVATETLALVSRRLGMRVAAATQRTAIARAELLFTTALEHAAAVEQFLDSGRSLSFVDCATMATMRSRGLTSIMTFDDDFARAGFDVLES